MDLVILTPVEVEYNIVRSQFDELHTVIKDGLIYEVTSFKGKHHDYSIALRQTGSKNENIALATEKAIQHFYPSMVFLLGICGGIKDVSLGDVVVGTKAYGYESTKEVNDGSVVRPDVIPFDTELVEWARQIARLALWKSRVKNVPDIKVVFAPIASGNKVIASTNSTVYQLLKKHYNDTGAVEMEAIGFAKVTLLYPTVRSMNIRGVSDLIDNKAKSDAKGSQERAITHALAFTLELLENLNFSQLKIYAVDAKELARKIEPLIFPQLLAKAGLKDSGNTKTSAISNIIWEKVNGLLEGEILDLRDNPKDSDVLEEVQWSIKYKLRKALKKDDQLRKELSSLLQKIDGMPQGEVVSISKSKNVVQGSTIKAGRDVKIGDEKIGQQINNTGAIKNQVNINENKGDLNFE